MWTELVGYLLLIFLFLSFDYYILISDRYCVDGCTVNAFKARLDKFWQHQLVKFDFTADLTGTGNRSEEVIK